MGFRTFNASIIVEKGKIINANSSDPEKLYPGTLLHFLQLAVQKSIDENCDSGELHIHSKGDNLLVVASGGLKNCRDSIINEVRNIFDLNIGIGPE